MLETTVQSICVTIGGGACARDVQLWLEDPEGTIYTLAVQVNDNQTPYSPCFTIDATATMAGGNGGMGSGPFTGAYVPTNGALTGTFNGVDPTSNANSTGVAGAWTLWVNDAGAGGGATKGCSSSIFIDDWSITFETTPPIDYVWSGAPLANLSTSTDSITTFTPPSLNYDLTYTVQITDATGCIGTDTIRLFCGVVGIDDYNLTGSPNEEGNLLNWTLDDSYDEKFFLERMNDNNEFEIIYETKVGNLKEFKFLDNDNVKLKESYRLKIKKSSDEILYTRIVEINRNKISNQFAILPNPATDLVKLRSYFDSELDNEIQIYDLSGKLIMKKDFRSIKGMNEIALDISELSNGMYHVVVKNELSVFKTRFIKE